LFGWRSHRIGIQLNIIFGRSTLENLWHNRVIALSGAVLAVDMVDKLARTGYINTKDLETLAQSLFVQNPLSTQAVYGGIQPLERGLEALIELLRRPKGMSKTAVIGYALSSLHLQKRLIKNRVMLQQIGDRIEKSQHQVTHFGVTHENVMANLASIYSDTISTFPFRIQVLGDAQYLQQNRIANQIRVLLLSSIRATTLWRQLGGKRWQFVFHSSAMLNAAEELLLKCKSDPIQEP
jgi:high frequency lysogenization protein